ncbi:hypothetical protein [Streptomyces albireticuli]|uniref:Uncharacterized protein n=1 Tax=Streptomyces albireticuli TaxID=1940 RepID=A0A2A2D964_9ACTN|nr:hypothetical protein [Streptomyces albireticuli]MCD9145906.1 hypothetical protein [Streptomyces albireticuli]MCD9166076.1 hypothetical protein [Streptomyces albireticuli]MCD9196356.1 hypothetical protein [Streptomyces albireticuli]PAU47976.1 hypothetical protein CK936_15820 [Streptomyces albireticuli]
MSTAAAQPVPHSPWPIERSSRGLLAALDGEARSRFISELLATGPGETENVIARWWAEAVRQAAGEVSAGSVTALFVERIIGGGTVDWDDMAVQRRQRGARFIDWDAIDRARAAAGR